MHVCFATYPNYLGLARKHNSTKQTESSMNWKKKRLKTQQERHNLKRKKKNLWESEGEGSIVGRKEK